MKESSPQSPFLLSRFQLNFHPNVYVVSTITRYYYSNSVTVVPRVCCSVRALRCSTPGFGGITQSSGGSGGGSDEPGALEMSYPWLHPSWPQR